MSEEGSRVEASQEETPGSASQQTSEHPVMHDVGLSVESKSAEAEGGSTNQQTRPDDNEDTEDEGQSSVTGSAHQPLANPNCMATLNFPVGEFFSTVRHQNAMRKTMLQQTHNADQADSKPLVHAMSLRVAMSTLKPAAPIEDYLQELLPAPLAPSKWGASPFPPSGFPAAPAAVQPCSEPPASSDADASASSEPAAPAQDLPASMPTQTEEPAEAETADTHPAEPVPQQTSQPQVTAEIEPVDEADDKNKLMATWRFAEVTEDGGVGIAFEDLEEESPADIEQLHEALQEMILHQEIEPAEEERSEEAGPSTTDEHPGPLAIPPSHVVPLAGHLESVPEGDEEADAASQASSRQQVASLSSQLALQEQFGKSFRRDPSLKGPPAGLAGQQVEEQSEIQPAKSSVEMSRQSSLKAGSAQSKADLAKSIRLGFHQGKLKPINIVLMIVGTRGDIQPFLGIGLKLKEYGHRVRIASHKVYREFVEGFGIEFYPLGGDPKVLSEFVVKHRGIMPGWDIKDALQQREQVREILYSTWGACVSPDPMHPNKPFMADAIVANPPCYGHTHCAERLNVPLHIVFTMPWTPTKAFPQPFARIKTTIGGTNSKAREIMNWMSYFAMEDLAWLGMSGMIKDFRQRVLGLKTWNKLTTSHAIYYSKVPVTYIWSPSLVTRANDWPSYVEVVGFVNVELKKLTAYTPPKEIQDFLDAGPPPVYIGFGSLVVDDAAKLTRQFVEALQRTGLRAIIQRGWGGLGAGYGQGGREPPEGILFFDSAPHDWLFQYVSAVVHHGGAGTTAAGLYAGKPTFIVPFFGDQPFWGAACAQAGVGPAPVPIDDLTTDRIVDALKELILPNRQRAADTLSARMRQEDGISGTVDHLHRTIYGALVHDGKGMLWMKPRQNNMQQPAAAEVATTQIREFETNEGGGMVHGILMLPWRVARTVKNFFTRNHAQAAAPPSAPTPAAAVAAAAAPAPAPAAQPHQPGEQAASAAIPRTPPATPPTAAAAARAAFASSPIAGVVEERVGAGSPSLFTSSTGSSITSDSSAGSAGVKPGPSAAAEDAGPSKGTALASTSTSSSQPAAAPPVVPAGGGRKSGLCFSFFGC